MNYQLTPWSSVFLQKLAVPQLLKKFSRFFLYNLQVRCHTQYPAPAESSPRPSCFLTVNVSLSSTSRCSKRVFTLWLFIYQNPIGIYFPPCVLRTRPILMLMFAFGRHTAKVREKPLEEWPSSLADL